MTVKIKKGTAKGRVSAPPSKSMAHRYLISAALTEKSEVRGVAYSRDIKATLLCLEALGAKVEINGDTVLIGGLNPKGKIKSNKLFCDESGSTLRFLLPLCLLFDEEITLMGSERLFERSLSVYEQICISQGIYFKQDKNSVTVKGKLKAGKYSVRGDISSQFISGLIFALSNLEEDSVIEITEKLESGSYLGLTISALAKFGIRIRRIDERTIYIKGSQAPKSKSIKVEGDYSNAAFLDAFNLLGGNVAVTGLKSDSMQGDRVYKDIFSELAKGKPKIDVSDCPDLAPIIMALAAAKNGVILTGTERLKIKESNRGEAMKEELAKLGAKVKIEENKITVKGGIKPAKTAILSHNDHRIVMAMAVLLSLTGGEILGAEAINKSFPDFFQKLNAIGIETEVDSIYETN